MRVPVELLIYVLLISHGQCSNSRIIPKFETYNYDTFSQQTIYTGDEIKELDPLQLFLYEGKEATRELISSGDNNEPCINDDPMVDMTPPQLIARNGYMAISHKIITQDGYILTVHRIPYAKNATSKVSPRKAILFQHGILSSSADWIVTGPKKGLAYILADAGYDVWLANARGNTYSKAHLYRDVTSSEFWDFSFHEISQYDLPAVIDYIKKTKGETKVTIDYIGHSMGTTALFALLSMKPEYNKILRAGFVLAPVVYMSVMPQDIHTLAEKKEYIRDQILKDFGMQHEFLPHNGLAKLLSQFACQLDLLHELICQKTRHLMCGHFDKSLLPMVLGHAPSGISTKTLMHYSQIINNGGRFKLYDYGSYGNYIRYGTDNPPEYPVENITLPIALLSARNDYLTSEVDLLQLYQKLQNPIEHYVVPSKEFDHIDFLFGEEAPKLLYEKLLLLLERDVSTKQYRY